MHSIDDNGQICVDLNDYTHLSDSIKFREKIDGLIQRFKCPKDIPNFSISMLFRTGQRYYLSNMYLWAIPYRTMGMARGDADHDRALYHRKEFFIQRDISYDETQIPIIKILESRYKLFTTFAMIRQCPECDFIIEAYNNTKIDEPEKFYHQVRNNFENFICYFIDAMQPEIITALPDQAWLSILNDHEFRRKIITRQVSIEHSTNLTPREFQCLRLISEGLNNKEIAERLFLSPETINTHAKSIRQKLDCKNITEAVAKALRRGMFA